MNDATIRDAAAIVVVRNRRDAPAVLMGQRGSQAVFMPNKVVFPGGAVESADAEIALMRPVDLPCRDRLRQDSRVAPDTLAATAIRELWEETGQILGSPGAAPSPHRSWRSFAAAGYRPDTAGLQFVFRAVTPAGRPRRFDARFFLVDAERLRSDPDDFSAASGELGNLQWVPIESARRYDLPFITQVVLGQVIYRLESPEPPESVPYFHGEGEDPHVEEIV